MLVRFGISILISVIIINADDSENSIDLNYMHYEDNNGVRVMEPAVSFSRKIGNNFSINGRFLLDGITAASRAGYNPSTQADTAYKNAMEEGIPVDAVSTATVRDETLLYFQHQELWELVPEHEKQNSLSQDAEIGRAHV